MITTRNIKLVCGTRKELDEYFSKVKPDRPAPDQSGLYEHHEIKLKSQLDSSEGKFMSVVFYMKQEGATAVDQIKISFESEYIQIKEEE